MINLAIVKFIAAVCISETIQLFIEPRISVEYWQIVSVLAHLKRNMSVIKYVDGIEDGNVLQLFSLIKIHTIDV